MLFFLMHDFVVGQKSVIEPGDVKMHVACAQEADVQHGKPLHTIFHSVFTVPESRIALDTHEVRAMQPDGMTNMVASAFNPVIETPPKHFFL